MQIQAVIWEKGREAEKSLHDFLLDDILVYLS